ncbi:hypothetical protein PHPALM_29295, partial [Phytophthora palmivora]
SNILSIKYCNVGICDHQASTCLLSTFTSSGRRKPQADWASATCLSKRLHHSKKPEPKPTYSSLPVNARMANFFCRASG